MKAIAVDVDYHKAMWWLFGIVNTLPHVIRIKLKIMLIKSLPLSRRKTLEDHLPIFIFSQHKFTRRRR